MRSAATLLLALLCSCGDDPVAGDVTPPARVSDLAATISGETDVVLSWTAPGDDGIEGTRVWNYDIRYFSGDLLANWEDASQIPTPSVPALPGETQELLVDSLSGGTWEFGLRAADEVPNWSGFSNVVSVTVSLDTIGPAMISDLQAQVAGSTITLTWTAPGDDGAVGMAATYDLRYATAPLDEGSWSGGTSLAIDIPGPAGTQESAQVTSLPVGSTYYFAIRASDDAGNESPLSNVVMAEVSSLQPTQITFDGDFGNGWPSWSSDGTSVLCTLIDNGVPQLFVAAADGSGVQKYTSVAAGAQLGDWSHDGSRFAFIASEERGSFTFRILSTMNALPDAPIQSVVEASTSSELLYSPRFSPGDSVIAYSVGPFVAGRVLADIYTVPSSGGTPELVFDSEESIRGPEWSPDGSMLAFVLEDKNIWLVPPTGGTPTQLTTRGDVESPPAYSPDGRLIAYVSSGTIWGIPSTGGGMPVQLVNDGGIRPREIDWSPDGGRIAYSKDIGGAVNIWVASTMN